MRDNSWNSTPWYRTVLLLSIIPSESQIQDAPASGNLFQARSIVGYTCARCLRDCGRPRGRDSFNLIAWCVPCRGAVSSMRGVRPSFPIGKAYHPWTSGHSFPASGRLSTSEVSNLWNIKYIMMGWIMFHDTVGPSGRKLCRDLDLPEPNTSRPWRYGVWPVVSAARHH